jgi:replicative DNA helicase
LGVQIERFVSKSLLILTLNINIKMKIVPIAQIAEKAALSLIAIDPDVLPNLSWNVDLFAVNQHKLIFNALERVYQRTGSTNAIGALIDLETTGKLASCGEKEGVMDVLQTIFLSPGAMCLETAADYRNQLLKAKSYRDTIKIWENNHDDVCAMTADLTDLAESFNSAIVSDAQCKDFKSHLIDFMDDLEDKSPLENFGTGVPRLDHYLGGGIRRGEMLVVGAQTSGGKSILLYQAALQALLAGKSVCIFSLEMPAKAILQRIASNLIGKSILSMREMKGLSEWRGIASVKDISSAITQLMSMNLTIRDDLSEVNEIAAEATRLASLGKADMIVVDYLQIVSMTKADNREQAVSELSRRLKLVALKTKSCVVTASQLNDDGAVRESRAIGHNADFLVIISHPDERKKETNFRKKSETQSTSRIRIDKNRRGQRDVFIPVKMRGEISRFEQVDEN